MYLIQNKFFKSVFCAIIIVCSVEHMYSQQYNTMVGIRVGDDYGFVAHQRIGNKSTVSALYKPGMVKGHEFYALILYRSTFSTY